MSNFDVKSTGIPLLDQTTQKGTTYLTQMTELVVGVQDEVVLINKEGAAFGSRTFDDANAYIKVDGSFKFKNDNGDVLIDSLGDGGDYINVINSVLDTTSQEILSDFDFGSTDYAGAVKSGDITWNTTTGAITGGSGVAIYRGGIVGASAGVATFTINATTGAATFAGTLSAPSGTLGTITSGTISGSTIIAGPTAGNNLKLQQTSASPFAAETCGELGFYYGTTRTGRILKVSSGYMYIHNDYLLSISSNGTLSLSGDPVSLTGSTVTINSTSNTEVTCDDWKVYYNDDNDGSDCYWYSNGSEMMKLSSSGNLTIDGNISKGGGSFKIDHPLKPKTHYLYHSFVESPEMINIYKGRAKTKNKKAIIELPSYFEALNENIEYNLTPIKKLAILAISKEVKNNKFEVISDKDCEFSWVVYGVRKDKYAKANPIIPEVKKEEKGYIHPELFK